MIIQWGRVESSTESVTFALNFTAKNSFAVLAQSIPGDGNYYAYVRNFLSITKSGFTARGVGVDKNNDWLANHYFSWVAIGY